MKKRQNRPLSAAGLLLKLAAAAAGALLLISVAVYTVTVVATDDFGASDADYISWCEEEYIARDFAGLYDELVLFELYGEHYDIYWEAVDAYRLLVLCRQHAQGAHNALPDAAQRYANTFAQLQAMAAAPQHERNGQLLQEFAAQAGQMLQQDPVPAD